MSEPVSQPQQDSGAKEEQSWLARNKIGVWMLAAYIVNCAVVNIANLVWPNNTTSNRYYTLITPPGWAFAIWGVIYVTEAVACILLLVPATKALGLVVVDTPIAIAWSVLCGCQALWAVVVPQDVRVAAAILAVACLAMLTQQVLSLRNFRSREMKERGALRQIGAYVAFVAPFSINAGWVTAATGLNVSLAAVANEASAAAQLTLAIVTILWCFAIAWTFGVFGVGWTARQADPALAGALVWALFAVSKHDPSVPSNASAGVITFGAGTPVTTALSNSATVGASVLLFAVVVRGVVDTIRIVRGGDDQCGRNKGDEMASSLSQSRA